MRKFATCLCDDDESTVQDNLSLTPHQMWELTKRGTPISTSNVAMSYVDGIPNPDWDIPIESQRGIDLNDLWTARQEFKAKLRNNIDNQNKSE